MDARLRWAGVHNKPKINLRKLKPRSRRLLCHPTMKQTGPIYHSCRGCMGHLVKAIVVMIVVTNVSIVCVWRWWSHIDKASCQSISLHPINDVHHWLVGFVPFEVCQKVIHKLQNKSQGETTDHQMSLVTNLKQNINKCCQTQQTSLHAPLQGAATRWI